MGGRGKQRAMDAMALLSLDVEPMDWDVSDPMDF